MSFSRRWWPTNAVECEECEGEGEVEYCRDYWCPYREHMTEEGWERCRDCDGEGYVIKEEEDG